MYSFSYPDFYSKRQDPIYIYGFALAHFALLSVGLGLVVPSWFDSLIPPQRRNEGHIPYAPCVTLDPDELRERQRLEAGAGDQIAGISDEQGARRATGQGDSAPTADGRVGSDGKAMADKAGAGGPGLDRTSSSEQEPAMRLAGEKPADVR